MPDGEARHEGDTDAQRSDAGQHFTSPAIRVPHSGEAFLKETDRWLRRPKNMGAGIVAFPEIYPQIAAPTTTRPSRTMAALFRRSRRFARSWIST